MLKKLTVLLVVILIASCGTTPEGYVVNGELRGDLENGTQVFLKTTDSVSRSLVEVDTTTIENGVFAFTGKNTVPKMYYLFFDGVRGSAPIILENGTISFTAQKDSLAFSNLKGTEQNEMFMTYLEESRRLSSMSRSMNEDFGRARAEKDTAMMESLRTEYLELQDKAKNYELDFVKENPNALIAALILDKVISSKSLPIKEVEELYKTLTPEIKETKPGKRIKQQIALLKVTAVGSEAPNFSAPNPEGNILALNDVKGKVTLVDFWAAWCKPCRAENPNIVSVYEKYKDKGLNVVGVSLDRTAAAWKKAIEEDGLAWNHVSNLQHFQDPIAQLYGINAIPAAFLLDEDGVIVAKNLRGPALEAKVAELLN